MESNIETTGERKFQNAGHFFEVGSKKPKFDLLNEEHEAQYIALLDAECVVVTLQRYATNHKAKFDQRKMAATEDHLKLLPGLQNLQRELLDGAFMRLPSIHFEGAAMPQLEVPQVELESPDLAEEDDEDEVEEAEEVGEGQENLNKGSGLIGDGTSMEEGDASDLREQSKADLLNIYPDLDLTDDLDITEDLDPSQAALPDSRPNSPYDEE